MLCGLKSRVPVPWGPEQMGLPEPNLEEECLWQVAWFLPQLLISFAPKATTHRSELILCNIRSQYFTEIQKILPNMFSMHFCLYGWLHSIEKYGKPCYLIYVLGGGRLCSCQSRD